MTVKTANGNTQVAKKATRRSEIRDRDCKYALKSVPVPQGIIERWKEELRAYLDREPRPKTITPFIHELGMSTSGYYKLLERHEDLKEEHEKVMQILGETLWGNSVDFKANWTAVKFMIHKYGKDFQEAKELEAKLKATESNNQGIQIVQMPAIPRPKVEE